MARGIEWLAEHEFDLSQTTGPVLIQTGCTFFKPVIYPALLLLISSVHSIGRSSFIIDQDLLQNSQLMAQGSSKIVWVDYQKGKSVALPENLRELLINYTQFDPY